MSFILCQNNIWFHKTEAHGYYILHNPHTKLHIHTSKSSRYITTPLDAVLAKIISWYSMGTHCLFLKSFSICSWSSETVLSFKHYLYQTICIKLRISDIFYCTKALLWLEYLIHIKKYWDFNLVSKFETIVICDHFSSIHFTLFTHNVAPERIDWVQNGSDLCRRLLTMGYFLMKDFETKPQNKICGHRRYSNHGIMMCFNTMFDTVSLCF